MRPKWRPRVRTGVIMDLYGKLHKIAYSAGSSTGPIHITIILDNVSLLELAAYGDADHVVDFLHYCRTLTVEQDGSLIMLNHGDIYSSSMEQKFISRLKYLAVVIIKADPLTTGLMLTSMGREISKVSHVSILISQNAIMLSTSIGGHPVLVVLGEKDKLVSQKSSQVAASKLRKFRKQLLTYCSLIYLGLFWIIKIFLNAISTGFNRLSCRGKN